MYKNLFILTFALMAYSNTSFAQKSHDCIVIDGPANLRQTPKGTILSSIPNNSTMLITGTDKDWLHVYGLIDSAGKLHCQPQKQWRFILARRLARTAQSMIVSLFAGRTKAIEATKRSVQKSV